MDIDIIAQGLNSLSPKIKKEDKLAKKALKIIINFIFLVIIFGLLGISIWMTIENFK